MVKYMDDGLGRTFHALSDPTRRAILARLESEAALSVSELAEPFPMQLNAVMKHLDVLSDAGLVVRSKSGRTVSVSAAMPPLCRATAGAVLIHVKPAQRWPAKNA